MNPATGRIADHLDARDVPNMQVRPNALFSLQLLDQPDDVARAARQAWEALVYPWGVATLDQGDPGFHPYHVAPGHYHKDAAYHNGAVWPWLNGIAIQRMIELGQADLAWRLFTNTNEIALTRGVVGGLPENLDAYPHPGESAPRLTGTYLQGWSNAEQLRVWYQGFLGLQPDLEQGVIRLAPRLPKAVGDVEFNSRIGAGVLHAWYERFDRGRRYTWRLQGQAVRLDLDIVPFERHSFTVAAGDTLIVEESSGGLVARHVGVDGGEQRTRDTGTIAGAPRAAGPPRRHPRGNRIRQAGGCRCTPGDAAVEDTVTNPAVTGTPAPASYSLPKTNAKVLALLESHLARARRVLDIGAGEGYLARRVHDLIKSHGYAAELRACDLFPENFRVPEVPCHAIDLHGGLPLDDQSVDLAYSVEVLEHLEDQFFFLREVHRVLRPGGRFVLTTPNVLSLTSRVRTLLAGFPELFGPLPIHGDDPQHVGGHIHPVSVYYISYMAEKAGFRVIGISTDRVKSSSAALLVLWPLVKLGAAIVAMHARRNIPAIYQENREHLARMNSFAVLTGRTVIVEMERRP